MFVRSNAYVIYYIWVTIIFNTPDCSVLSFSRGFRIRGLFDLVVSAYNYNVVRIVMYHAYCIYFYSW